ncbi:MAG: heat shock protein HspQ [Magnetococcales bacterium]|nr:heat shock protein HspQ [Magnetococcales bacterium]
MAQKTAKFSVGQVVQHALFNYRGVIVDVDPEFTRSESWYQRVARSRPPKDQPWYQILVHDSDVQTYVAERHLLSDAMDEPIDHPQVDQFFKEFRNGCYTPRSRMN